MPKREQCEETHNPGVWPYIARCKLPPHSDNIHMDVAGNTWKSEPKCHCGNPVAEHQALRNMCAQCGDFRCDLEPSNCAGNDGQA